MSAASSSISERRKSNESGYFEGYRPVRHRGQAEAGALGRGRSSSFISKRRASAARMCIFSRILPAFPAVKGTTSAMSSSDGWSRPARRSRAFSRAIVWCLTTTCPAASASPAAPATPTCAAICAPSAWTRTARLPEYAVVPARMAVSCQKSADRNGDLCRAAELRHGRDG